MSGPSTVDTSTTCQQCGRSISERSAALVDDNGCPFCREGEGE
ncbi:hypothetical protein ACFQGE_07435 [Halomicroarcula sp. GCM10025817]|nr:hypothetical protein [Halomicroarcula sp. SYNS111]